MEAFLASILRLSEEEEGLSNWGEPDWSYDIQHGEDQSSEESLSEGFKSFYRLSEPQYIEEPPSIVTDWQQMMVNFNPDDMFSFNLPAQETEVRISHSNRFYIKRWQKQPLLEGLSISHTCQTQIGSMSL